jgi:hypothetical protein
VLDTIAYASPHLKMLDISGNPNIQLSHFPPTTTIGNLYIWDNEHLSPRNVRAALPIRHIHARTDYLATFAEYFRRVLRPDPTSSPTAPSPEHCLSDALASYTCWVSVHADEPSQSLRQNEQSNQETEDS